MRRILLYQIIGWLPFFLAAPVQSQQLRAMQYNIHGTLGTIANNGSAGAKALARVVNYNQPDLLLLCEVQDNGVAPSQAALIDWVTNNLPYLGSQPGASFWVAVSSQTDGFIRNAAISRYPISNETTFSDGLRGLHAFQLNLGTTNLQVFHSHLKCCSSGNSCPEKQSEAQFDADTISGWASTSPLPYIFGGDWNEDEENPECAITGTYHPITTIRQAGFGEFKPTTLDGEYRTWSTAGAVPSIRFDYILAATNRLNPGSGFVFSSKSWASHGLYTNSSAQNLVSDSATASDHYAVVVDYAFLAPGAALLVSPVNNFTSAGRQGGPFSPSNQTYSLSNAGVAPMNWAAANASAWLTLSATNGVLAGGSSTNVVLSINTNANDLADSTYSDLVSFTNVTNGNGSTTRAATLTIASTTLQTIQTVFVILMENQNWSAIKGSPSAPYLNNSVLPNASHAEQYYNPPGVHPSLPNYLWLEAGTDFNITDDGDPATRHQSTTNHLVTQLNNAGVSWRAYQEDICGCYCPLVYTNQYAPRHNPFVYFDDVTNTNNLDSAFCTARIRPYTQLAGDLQSNTVARYNFITPNVCNDMHDSSGCATADPIKNGDTWLSANLPTILGSQAYSNNGAVFILWDESDTGDGPIGLILLSPLAKANGYSSNVRYTHSSTLRTLQEIFNVGPLLGDAANAADLSDLFSISTSQLSVNPASGLASSGPVGGPFSPGSQTYTLTNSGDSALGWSASHAASWVSLSSTGGTIAPLSSVVINVVVNTNAGGLSPGAFSDTIGFTNLSNGSGNTSRSVSLTVNGSTPGSFGFYDDFTMFTPGNLVGQAGWTQLSTAAAQPLQVNGGQVTIPIGQLADNQDAFKNFTQTNGTVFYGLTLTVNGVVTNNSPSYFAALYTGTNASGFANFRLTAKAGDVARTNFVLGIRVTGQAGDPYTFGTTGLSTGAQCRVIVRAPGGGASMSVFVNPTSSDLAAQAPYANNPVGSGTPPPTVGSFVISQFGSASAPNDGVSIGKVVIADNFTTVYNDLAGFLPPLASFLGSPTSGAEPLVVTFTDTSTGTITNRLWNFGDGVITNTSAIAVSHAYGAGTYGVALVVSGPAGVSTNAQTNYIATFTAFQNWQLQYFGVTNGPAADATADPDEDGQNNLTEFLAGTNPTNRASVFKLTAIGQEGDNIRVTWSMGSGRTNALQTATGDASDSYTDLFIVSNTIGAVMDYVHVGAATSAPVRYYRVKLLP